MNEALQSVGCLGRACEWAVVLVALNGVLPLPTRATEVFETVEVSTEIRTNHTRAHRTERVLEVGVDLDLCVCVEGGVGVC